MAKAKFLNRAIGEIEPSGHYQADLVRFNANTAHTDLGGIMATIAKFSTQDFGRARLNRSIPSIYSNPEKVAQRADAFSEFGRTRRPAVAYLVNIVDQHALRHSNIGMATLARATHGKLYGLKDDGIRQGIAWYDRSSLSPDVSVRSASNSVMLALVKAATAAGLTEIRILRAIEVEGHNEDLIVVEHSIDPVEHEFTEIGIETIAIEGAEYDGVVWSRNLQ